MILSRPTVASLPPLTKIRTLLGASVIAMSALAVMPIAALAQSNSTATEVSLDASSKFNAYVKAFNSVNEMFYGGTKGMADLLAKYQSQNLANRSSGSGSEPIRYMNTSMLRNSVDALRNGARVAGVGPYAKVDAAAKAMLATGEPLLRLSREMEDYFSSKKYLEDGFARGREMDGPYIAGWTQFIADHDRMSDELDAAIRTNRLANIEQLRFAKENLRAAAAEVMLYSSDLIDVFDDVSDFRNKDKTALGDPLASQLEKSVSEIRELSQGTGANASLYDLLAGDMSEFLGRYRSLKSSFFPSAKDFDEMIDRYNRAVNHSNRLR